MTNCDVSIPSRLSCRLRSWPSRIFLRMSIQRFDSCTFHQPAIAWKQPAKVLVLSSCASRQTKKKPPANTLTWKCKSRRSPSSEGASLFISPGSKLGILQGRSAKNGHSEYSNQTNCFWDPLFSTRAHINQWLLFWCTGAIIVVRYLNQSGLINQQEWFRSALIFYQMTGVSSKLHCVSSGCHANLLKPTTNHHQPHVIHECR